MGVLRALGDSFSGTLADQWKDIFTAGRFDEHVVVAPGVLQSTNRGRGANVRGSEGVITSGSLIYVPENTAAFIFSGSGIENVISQPGTYEYQNGQQSIFNGGGIGESLFSQMGERIGYGGISGDYKQIAFVNLREIRDIKFGTRGPLMYNDKFYGTDLEIFAYGSFAIKVIDPVRFVRNFVPPNVMSYTFDDPAARSQVLSDFLQSFIVAVNSLSAECRISQLPAKANEIAQCVHSDPANAGTWRERFGFDCVKVSIENIEFSPESRELVKQFSSNKMNVKAYEGVSVEAGNMAAQQKIAQGIQDGGLGEMGGMLFGMNMAQGLGPVGQMPGTPGAGAWPGQPAAASVTNPSSEIAPAEPAASASAVKPQALSLDDQLNAVKKLKELLDAGILSQDEFEAKKKQILGL
ncbi:SPFH domain-containing protein [Bifidobacterium imperatoris]|uniref:SPFH domain-containing protein n=1 Tax=Bifidobacterium imperatoris TaxID=2020965 RepID=A0A2N5IS92_9BIFI|nr:SPFH domain-containing protein [Bifidobacterium imperatoris]PLS24833.1 virion core protein [Bifidobacterium imperatoris]QSY57952.1 SPFH domain-containing protein [Bifidobacterium imperatoris]